MPKARNPRFDEFDPTPENIAAWEEELARLERRCIVLKGVIAAARHASGQGETKDEQKFESREEPRPNGGSHSSALTVRALIAAYKARAESPIHSVRHHTRLNYERNLDRIDRTIGVASLASMKQADINRAWDDWTGGKKFASGKQLITMLRMLIHFGATVLEDGECVRLSVLLRTMSFSYQKPETKFLTLDYAKKIIREANSSGYHAIALAQALQIECALRQTDVIGQWVPTNAELDTPAIVTVGEMKWVRGVTREEVVNGVLTHTASWPGGGVLTIDLSKCELVQQQWVYAPKHGPLIIDPETAQPYEAWKFRRVWRQLAKAAGVPPEMKSFHSRDYRMRPDNAPTENMRAAEAPASAARH
jgi:hypothetical protein